MMTCIIFVRNENDIHIIKKKISLKFINTMTIYLKWICKKYVCMKVYAFMYVLRSI